MATLESIGRDFGVTRERVRQIQNTAIEKIKPKLDRYKNVFQSFLQYFRKRGGIGKEEFVLSDLGGQNYQNEVYALLTIKEPFQRFREDEDFYSLWTTDPAWLEEARQSLDSLFQKMQKERKLLREKEIGSFLSLPRMILTSYLSVSKRISKNQDGFYGLTIWPEINSRGVKDKAYLALKKTGRPLHFVDITNLIQWTHPQTVHNELIKDERFILVGRGIYALREWGYEPGNVRDVILRILKNSPEPLKKEKVVKMVLAQRLVKENTVLLNLNNKKFFIQDSNGRYRPKTNII